MVNRSILVRISSLQISYMSLLNEFILYMYIKYFMTVAQTNVFFCQVQVCKWYTNQCFLLSSTSMQVVHKPMFSFVKYKYASGTQTNVFFCQVQVCKWYTNQCFLLSSTSMQVVHKPMFSFVKYKYASGTQTNVFFCQVQVCK